MGINDLMRLSPVPDLPEPGERARLRQLFGISQAQLARSIGVSRNTLIAWERGTKNPAGDNREAYAAILSAWAETEKQRGKGKGK
jgi:DNA-binding XRE family transcriptional regulator